MRTDSERLDDVESAALLLLVIHPDDLMVVTGERSRAAQKLLEIVGEALKNISEALRAQLPTLDFVGPARMRDRLAHRYFDVDGRELCDVTAVDLPRLLAQLRLARLVGIVPPRR